MLDGAMARQRGGGTRFGAVLDATCDRIGDGAIFCGLLWWAAFGMRSTSLVVATLICLVTSQVISYIKARAEASGLSAEGGMIERPERLIIVLVGAGLSGLFGVPWLLHVAMWVLAVTSLITAGPARAQRADLAGSDGSTDQARHRLCRRRETGDQPSHDDNPAGADAGHLVGWQVHGLGVCGRLAARPRHAGSRGAQRFRCRCALRGPRRRARTTAQEPGPGHRRPARPRAGRADSCFACLIRPILAGGVPVAVDGS